jgi:hypothetical protein
MDTGQASLVWLAQGVATVFLTGVWALLPEILSAQFPIHLRYTGISLCMQGASVLGGTAPYVATRLLDAGNGAPWLVAWLLCATAAVSAVGLRSCTRRYAADRGTLSLPSQREPADATLRTAEEIG